MLFGVLPSFVWLYFFLKEDIHPEPKKMIFKTFVFGALVAAFAVPLEYFSQAVFKNFGIGKYDISSFLFLAAIEEILKFCAAFWAAKKSRFFDEPADAMIYMITAALGFAALENIFIVFGNSNGQLDGLASVAAVVVLRFVGATLLHALSSGIFGYFWAKSVFAAELKNRKITLIKGAIIAVLLHAVFNYFILLFSEALIYPTVLLIIAALFIFWDFEKLKKSTLFN